MFRFFRNKWVLGFLVLAVAYLVFQLGFSSGISPAGCPANPTAAGKLFSGAARNWVRGDLGGWETANVTASRTVTVPAWYARVLTSADGTQQFFGAVVAETRVQVASGQSLELICPVR